MAIAFTQWSAECIADPQHGRQIKGDRLSAARPGGDDRAGIVRRLPELSTARS